MTINELLRLTKTDLRLSTVAYDDLLTVMLRSATDTLKGAGIRSLDTVGNIADAELVSNYAAWRFRVRNDANTTMPEFLRRAIHDRLMREKGGGEHG